MQITLDSQGYVEMLVRKGTLPNSILIPDDDTIDMNYLSCYKLDSNKMQLVLDAQKLQRLQNNLKAESLIYDLKKQVSDSDYKVLRHIRETALGIPTSISQEEYLSLEAQRESLVRQVREIEDGTKLETNASAILQEGYIKRQEEIEKNENIEDVVKNTVPVLQKEIREVIQQTKVEPQSDDVETPEATTEEAPVEEVKATKKRTTRKKKATTEE